MLDDFQGFFAETIDDELGGTGAKPFDDAASQVCLDGGGVDGQGALHGGDFELFAVFGVVQYCTGNLQMLAGRGERNGADTSDIKAFGGTDFDNAVAVLFVTEENGGYFASVMMYLVHGNIVSYTNKNDKIFWGIWVCRGGALREG